VANGLNEARLAEQRRHIRDVEDRVGRLRIASGVEVDILADGRLDIDPDHLRHLDWVIASVHSHLNMTGDEMTARLITAMESGVVDCIGHPTNRRLGHREASPLDMEALLSAARRLGVALEVNGNPGRMDLNDIHCRRAREAGVPLAINTDAHSPSHLSAQDFGVLTARRGWVEARHVLNCQPWSHLADRRNDRLRHRNWPVPERTPAPSEPAPDKGGSDLHHPHYLELEDTVSAPDDSDLETMLDGVPLDDRLRARLETFLREGGDNALVKALERRGDNAMQVAFALLVPPITPTRS
jgi:DNA polymerase (family 10)